MDNPRKTSADSPKKGLEEATQYVTKAWFPINTTLLRTIQTKLKQGVYNSNRNALFGDLKSDQALFTYLLSRLGEVIEVEHSTIDPAALIRTLEIERLASILEKPAEDISSHRFDATIKPQVMRIRHSLISTSTVEALAQKSQLDSNIGFVCGSVRQLGLNLIAWNFPRIYTKALASLQDKDDGLDIALFKVLGYSPLQLGVRVALGWSNNPDLKSAVGLEGDSNNGLELIPQGWGDRMKGLCDIGESFALLHDPEHFPNASADAPTIIGQITQVLGPQGLQLIQSRLQANSQGYQQVSPALCKFEVSLEGNVRAANTNIAARLLQENGYVSKCPEAQRESFRRVYEHVQPGRVSTTGINILVSEVLPSLGFIRGCVYLVDMNKMTIVPMLRIGDTNLERFRSLPCSGTGETTHPVVGALQYSTPIIQENAFLNGDQVSHVTGVFGNSEKTGVLYLEMSPELCGGDRHAPLLYFKAARECLRDCLNLR